MLQFIQRGAVFAYGVVSYLIFLATFLYAIGFVGNFVVPKSIDAAAANGDSGALLIDMFLLGLFAVPHSIMARPWFKKRWTMLIAPAIERSTYVAVSSLLLALLFWQWRPISEVVWEVVHPAGRFLLAGLFCAGWIIVLWATFEINHFDLFGLRQVFLYALGRPYTPVGFKTPALYRIVRHPIMLGFLIAFWAAPTMTYGHLTFATATTVYILIAVRFEDRDLLDFHGETYAKYRQQVRMLVPLPK